MKTINELITESRGGSIKKLDMLTIMVAYQMWKEYKLYDEFFGKLTKDEQEEFLQLNAVLEQLEDDNSRVQWSFIKEYHDIINKTADYVLSCPDDEFSKSDKRIWKEIKQHVS